MREDRRLDNKDDGVTTITVTQHTFSGPIKGRSFEYKHQLGSETSEPANKGYETDTDETA